jgi:hypothetical protein
MLIKGILALILIGLVAWAVRTRVKLKRIRGVDNVESTVASPASIALGELVAIAGGIYLSLVLLTSFLKLSLPEKVCIYDNLLIDPLALAAIAIAILQPLFLSLLRRFR